MIRMCITMLIIVLITCYSLKSQEFSSVNNWMEYMEQLGEDLEDTSSLETLFSELSYLSQHPYDLNTVTKEELDKLPFLQENQIEEIIRYKWRYGNFLSIYELKNIRSLDFYTLSLLIFFVEVGEQNVENHKIIVDNLFKYGTNELIIRYDKCFQQKKGYLSQPDSILAIYPNRKYRGEPYYHSIRYSYNYDNSIYFGVVGEKDMGEPFWNEYHKGYDYYSCHLFIKDRKWLKTFTLGDYKASFGQGLIMSNDFSLSRGAMITNIEKRNNGFRRHYSTNENDFLRGIAVTGILKNMELSLFYSHRNIDAYTDSIYIRSFKTDGLHRLQREWEKRKNVFFSVYGGNIRYNKETVSIGFTTVTSVFNNHIVEPEKNLYNVFQFHGRNTINVGIDYSLKLKSFKLFGETAIDQNRVGATLHAIQLTPVSYLSFLFLYRYYHPEYYAFFGNSFSQSSGIQNEKGVYLGIQCTPFPYWKISGYVDYFSFPWLKYGIDAPSRGKEYMMQISHSPNTHQNLSIRYRYRQKEKNHLLLDDHSNKIIPAIHHRLRFQYNYSLDQLTCKTSLEGILYDELNKDKSKGYMFSQNIGWKLTDLPVEIDLYMALFSTDDYNSRISSYEKNMLYVFYSPSLYDKGLRLSGVLKWKINKVLTLSAKLGHTKYKELEKIGSGLEEIEGNKRTELYTMIKWKF